MKKKLCFSLLLCVFSSSAQANSWFLSQNLLTKAHQHLLTGQLEPMFASLVELWQLNNSTHLSVHLNELLAHSLIVDCGKGLDKQPFPQWLTNLRVRQIEIQNAERLSYQLTLEATTKNTPLVDLKLRHWEGKPLTSESAFNQLSTSALSKKKEDNQTPTKLNESYVYQQRYHLNHKPKAGLYRLDILTEDNNEWSAWLILLEDSPAQRVLWTAENQWKVEKNKLLNAKCPLPKLTVSVLDYQNGHYNEVWKHHYEKEYPSSLEFNFLPSERYLLSVSMNFQRWQGSISIEQSQVIHKSYEVLVEE